MSKFGELIDINIPVLLDFFTEWNDQSTAMHPVLRDVAAALGDKAKIIKIDIDKNKTRLKLPATEDMTMNIISSETTSTKDDEPTMIEKKKHNHTHSHME